MLAKSLLESSSDDLSIRCPGTPNPSSFRGTKIVVGESATSKDSEGVVTFGIEILYRLSKIGQLKPEGRDVVYYCQEENDTGPSKEKRWTATYVYAKFCHLRQIALREPLVLLLLSSCSHYSHDYRSMFQPLPSV